MSDAQNEHRRPHPQPMAAPYLEFDIARELQQLHREAGWQSGQNAKTLVKYDGLRIVLVAFENSRAPHRGANLDTNRRGAHPGSCAGAKLRVAVRRSARVRQRLASRR